MPQVRLFGTIGDAAGWSERTVPGETLGALKAMIAADDPQLSALLSDASTLVILNHALIPASQRGEDRPLDIQDEMAFGSPVGGG